MTTHPTPAVAHPNEPRLIAALNAAEGISGRPHGEHGFDAWCPVCTGDSKAIASLIAPTVRSEAEVKIEAYRELVAAFRAEAEKSATRDGNYELSNLADMIDDHVQMMEAG